MKKILMIFMLFIMATIITGCGNNEDSLKLTNKSSEIAILGDVQSKKDNIIKEVDKLMSDYDSKDLVVRLIIDTTKVTDNYNRVNLALNYNNNVPEDAKSIANELFPEVERMINYYVENPVVTVTIRDSKNNKEIYTQNNKGKVKNKIEEIKDKEYEESIAVKIQSVNLSYKGDYVDINVKVLNQSGRDIDYVKLNLYYYDDKKNIFRSEWTNDNAVIKNGATQVISKMTKHDFKSVSVEVDDINFR